MPDETFPLYEVTIHKDPAHRIDKFRANRPTTSALYETTIKDAGKPVEVVTKSTFAASQQVIDRMIQCAEIHRSLHGHPSITKVLGIKVHDPYVSLIVEKADGSLRDAFNEKHPNEDLRNALLSAMERRDIVRHMATGLSYIHSKTDDQNDQITHRDVKLDNILIFKRERDEKFDIKYTDFDSAKQFDVDESVGAVTTDAFTEVYQDPNLERMLNEGKAISIKDLVNNDIWAAALAMFEVLADGKHLFAGKNKLQTMINIANCDLGNLYEADIDPAAKNLIHTMTRQNPMDRISMEEVVNAPYFHENNDHIRAISSLSEAILDLDNSAKSKNIRDEINKTFFMVFQKEWKSLPFVHSDILNNRHSRAYSNDFIAFLRYARNLLQHAQQHKETLKSLPGCPRSAEDVLELIRKYAAGTLIHVQWVAKRFFPHLPWTKFFPENCAKAYEEWMKETGKRIETNPTDFYQR